MTHGMLLFWYAVHNLFRGRYLYVKQSLERRRQLSQLSIILYSQVREIIRQKMNRLNVA